MKYPVDDLIELRKKINTLVELQKQYDELLASEKTLYKCTQREQEAKVVVGHIHRLMKRDSLRRLLVDETSRKIDVWVDGSWSPKRPGIAGWGFCGSDGFRAHGSIHGTFAEKYAHICGELEAVKAAVCHYASAGYVHMVIRYDFDGIRKHITGEFGIRNDFTQQYYDFIERYRTHGITFEFVKVESKDNKAHDLAGVFTLAANDSLMN